MKIHKILYNLFKPQQTEKVTISLPPCPVVYDRNNVTAEEFREYIQWLAKNNINRTVYEPDRFITQIERAQLAKKKLESDEYRRFVKYLAENNINRTFLN